MIPSDIYSMLPYLRMNNIMPSSANNYDGDSGDDSSDDQSQQPNTNQSLPINDPNAGIDVNKRLSELYKPSTRASDAFNDHLAKIPQRSDYKPNMLTKIGAIMAGAGSGVSAQGISDGSPIGFHSTPGVGFNTMQGILNSKYDQADNDWINKGKPLEFAANEEVKNNNISRQLAEQTISREIQNNREVINANRLTETNRANQAKEDNNANKTQIAQQRADAYDFKSRNPAYKSYIDENNQLVFVNPVDPSKVVKTGITTNKMSDEDKINLQVQGRLSEIQAQGANQIGLENAKQGNRTTNETQRQKNRLEVKTTPSGNAVGANAGTETDTTIEPEVKEGGILGFGGKVITPTTRKVSRKPLAKPITPQQPANQPQIRMKSPDGGFFMVNQKDVDDSVKHGWQVVK